MTPLNVLVTVAPNGARRGKQDHPEIPLSAAEIAVCAHQCLEAGAAMIHLHVRDRQGRHTLAPDAYREALAAVRRSVGKRMILQVTTEAVGLYSPEQQISVVDELRPEAVSLALKELLPSSEKETEFANFLVRLKRWGTAPQFILYSPEEVVRFNALCRRGLIPWEHPWVLFVLGRYGEPDRQPPRLNDYLDYWCGPWGVCAFGYHEQKVLIEAAERGGHPRIGFENNTVDSGGNMAKDNASQVRALAEALVSRRIGLLSADQARELLVA